ncbi:glycosyltransferase family 4 protein [Methanosarcina sp. T3]|uniref:glycosyltransferase family 4 protein n=1 Tax=Methanosarcina sp. T3 TaxID=3439062 RepID=UPI003F866B54
MRIAIVAPSPVPFTVGGAEKLWWGLQNYINDHTTHQCELLKVPTRENNFWDLIESYSQFYNLDLSYFDMVISTKYPAWMVKHQNHIVYLQHHLRGLFDTYHFCNEPVSVPQNLRVNLVNDILKLIDTDAPSEKNIEKLFEKLNQLKADQQKYNSETFKFPGSFIRAIIHFFDAYALASNRIRNYYAISENVKQRKDYFPHDARVGVIYHPSKIENFVCKSYDYLFTVSRLDVPKRIDLLVKAMKHVHYNVKFKIAGTGPEENRLKELAKGDERIEFIGYTSEEDLINLYSNALAILYIPYDEDYGLITIEGMMSHKPVITSTDSGGSLEFVDNYETGFAVDPKPEKIAEKINYLMENKEKAITMGSKAYRKVEGINWGNVVSQLLDDKQLIPDSKKKILVLATYSCYPPRGGGQHRLYNIYSLLAKEFDVTICSIIETNKQYQNLVLDNGLRQICIPQSIEHARHQWEAEKKVGVDLYDVAMINFVDYSKEYVEKVKELAEDSDIIVFSHPYLWPLNKFVDPNKRVIYEAHNLEYLLKKDYVKDARYTTEVYNTEKEASLKSDLIFCTSEEDKQNLIEIYGSRSEKILVTPNGVDTARIPFITNEERERQKKLTGLSGSITVIFVGSWHPPNLEALKFITGELCKKQIKYKFIVVGSVKNYYFNEYGKLPKNVLAFGTVDEDEKYEIYKLADIAINPMFSGSGTNLKMLDYMSAGIPVVSTPIGSRGLDLENEVHALISPSEEFQAEISRLLESGELQQKLRINARNLVEQKYSWEIIAQSIIDKLKEEIN